jgi:hypothetical protein
MKEIQFYKFIRDYVFQRHVDIMQRRQWLRCIRKPTATEQAIKVDEELNEFLDAKEHAPRLMTHMVYNLKDDLFIELYRDFIKDTKESELADVILAKCYLMFLLKKESLKFCPIWFVEGHFDNIYRLSIGFKDIKLHLKAKMRYNKLRQDW